MTYIPATAPQVVTICSNQSLGTMSTFVSNVYDVSLYGSIALTINSIGSGTLVVSNVGSWSINTSNTTVLVTPTTQYIQFSFVNDGTPQTSLTIAGLFTQQPKVPMTFLSQTPTDSTNVTNTRSVISGKGSSSNVYNNVSVEPAFGSLFTSIKDPLTAFGELAVAQDTPTIQASFIYGVSNVLLNWTGNVYANNGMAIVSSAPGTTSRLWTRKITRYRPGEGTKMRTTGMFTPGVTGATQIVGFGGPDLLDILAFGYNGTQFGILYTQRSIQTWIPQGSWNYDTFPSLDPTKLNVFQIKFQYLGAGNISFYIVDPVTSHWIMVHQIHNANTNTQPNLRNPSFQAFYSVSNSSSTNPVNVSSSSVGMFIEGTTDFLGPRTSLDNTISTSASQTNLILIQNSLSYNGITNKTTLIITNVSVAANSPSTGIATLRIIRNPPVTGTLTWNALPNCTTTSNGLVVTGTSCITYSTSTSTTSTAVGDYCQVFAIGNSTSIDVRGYDLTLLPGDTYVFSLLLSSGNNVNASIGVVLASDQ